MTVELGWCKYSDNPHAGRGSVRVTWQSLVHGNDETLLGRPLSVAVRKIL